MKIERKKRVQPCVPMAPMGDIAFLLIIFFMLTSTFIHEAHLTVSLPESPDIERLGDGHLSVLMDQDGELWVQGHPCRLPDLAGILETELTSRPDDLITLKIDRAVRQDQFAPVLVSLSGTGARIAWLGDESNE